MKSLTLGFNFTSHLPSIIRQLGWVTRTLQSLFNGEGLLGMEDVDILIGDVKVSRGWIQKLNILPWAQFRAVFSPGGALCWPKLQRARIILGPKKKHALSSAKRTLLEQMLASKLATGEQDGFFELVIQDFPDPFAFGDLSTVPKW